MSLPGVHLETIENPVAYSVEQIDEAGDIAWKLKRGRFVLCEEPSRCPACNDEPVTFCVVCGRS